MYYPYFRGKQFEIITIRDNAKFFHDNKIYPIIEPVKESFSGLIKAIDQIKKEKSKITIIINPKHGQLRNTPDPIKNLILNEDPNSEFIRIGILINSDDEIDFIEPAIESFGDHKVSFIHYSNSDPLKILKIVQRYPIDRQEHIFIGELNKLYRKHFSAYKRIIIKDGFKHKKSNKDHLDFDDFSELHATFLDEGFQGFGDFLTVGDNYSESGGPAYTVAIHLTCINKNTEIMHIHHFKSDSNDSPVDPAGKFLEALEKFNQKFNSGSSHLINSNAVKELLKLYEVKHFPGLGYLKKLSLQHHLETIADYFKP